MDLKALKWDESGLVTVVVQDRVSGEIRMLAHANRAALEATLATARAHFFSRSRGQLWRKGESSGHELRVSEVWADCDGDALVYLADPEGPSCHTNRDSCFFRRVGTDGSVTDASAAHASATLPRLFAELRARTSASGEASYTRRLLDEGAGKIGDKVREEAAELARALLSETDQRVVSEAADVVYHVLVGLLARGMGLRDVEAELARRFGVSGLAEKASRTPAGG